MSTLEKATCRPAVFPYFAERDQFPPDTLNLIYRKLQEQDVLADLVHEKGISEEDFVKFVDQDTLSYILLDLASNQIAGIGWFDAVEQGDCLKKARSAVAFFKEFWNPKVTEAFGNMLLSHAFNVLEIDLVYGMTPASNKLVQKYCKRLGFNYVATIPNFCCRRGELTDALVCTMTRDAFNARLEEATEEEVGG